MFLIFMFCTPASTPGMPWSRSVALPKTSIRQQFSSAPRCAWTYQGKTMGKTHGRYLIILSYPIISYDILWYPISIHLYPRSPCFGVSPFGTLSFWPGLSFTWLSRASSSWELKKAKDEEDDVDPGGMSRGGTSSIFSILHACTFFKLPAFLHDSQLPALGCFGHFRATVQQLQKLIEMLQLLCALWSQCGIEIYWNDWSILHLHQPQLTGSASAILLCNEINKNITYNKSR